MSLGSPSSGIATASTIELSRAGRPHARRDRPQSAFIARPARQISVFILSLGIGEGKLPLPTRRGIWSSFSLILFLHALSDGKELTPRGRTAALRSPEFGPPPACPRPRRCGPVLIDLHASSLERARPGPALASHGRNGDRGDGRARPGSPRPDGPPARRGSRLSSSAIVKATGGGAKLCRKPADDGGGDDGGGKTDGRPPLHDVGLR
jgi:hypothetical protein